MDLLAVAEYFGFTPQTITPLVVFGVAVFIIVCKHTHPFRESLRDIRERFGVVESRVGDLWKDKLAPASSPRQLNERGSEVLESSGIKEIIDRERDVLLAAVRSKELKTPYDAESCIMEIVSRFPDTYPGLVPELKEGAFKSGASLGAVLFVGGIYLRNLIFKDLGLSLEDI